jgi:transposase-like protein
MNENDVIQKQGAGQVVRRTAAEREALVNEYRASGLTLKEFAKQHGLPVSTVSYWQRQKKAIPARFVEVKVSAPVQMPMEVELKNGVRIRLCCTDKRIGLAELIREVSRC